MTAPKISIIVLSYNGRKWLVGCLDALAEQLGAPAFETILVDNGSTDDSTTFVRERYPDVRLLDTGTNLGFAGGNNAGARLARGRALVFLNNDTIAAPDWLARLHGALLARPQYAMAASRLVFLDAPDRIDSAGDGYLRAGGAFKRGHGEASAAYDKSREVFGACGAAFIIRREVFEELGGFDEAFFMVYEDVDLSYRAHLRGHRCWYEAEAVVRHAGSATLGRLSDSAVFHGQRNLEWTWIKNTPAWLLLRSAPAHLAYSMAGVLHYIGRRRGWAALRGKGSALAGLPRMLQARRTVQRTATPGAGVEQLMERGWIGLKRRQKHAR